MEQNKKSTTLIALSTLLIILFSISVSSIPSAPSINYITNSTSASAGVGTLRSGDDGGFITTINLNVLQQNLNWKAYVGNVTGRFVLEDSGGFSIYEWDMSLNTQGKVFIARNGTIGWGNVSCSNRSTIYSEESTLGIVTANTDSINSTFNSNIHKSFTVAGKPITNSTCPSIATYINDTVQVFDEDADFQEVLLVDSNGAGNLIYASILEQDVLGYRNDSTFDFQAIVADDDTDSVITNYYFYVELGI